MPYTDIFRKLLNLVAPRVVFKVENHRFLNFCDSKYALHGHISRTKENYTWDGKLSYYAQ